MRHDLCSLRWTSRSLPAIGVIVLVLGCCLILAIGALGVSATDPNVVVENESAYVEPVPEPGDEYYEATAIDGSWISYINPRDEYQNPYMGGGSGKIGVTLLNQSGEPIVGTSVPNTTVTIPTGESLAWHSAADPITVEFPLTEHYDRPLDADQFGTSSELPQGDGYLDSHTVEFHGLAENATIEYGEATVTGTHADRIEVVGYIEQTHRAWDSDVDPLTDAIPYEETGGEWTYRPNASHGQVIVVLQLTSPTDTDKNETASARIAPDVDTRVGVDEGPIDPDDDPVQANTTTSADDPADSLIGMGVVPAIIAVALALEFRRRNRD